ncbi:hypothetical protein EXIGLDRAFT_736446 [Exidia glandulosa HHB12029]|uniref:Uncharacterized protein n=1 Tax=Exidia glandulosa HHB12029 TaxID=1314781 RepID=A0A165JDM8_EXIGL|nr:hypothetical protein EXIGLDRAFT_736446 [Exidia glandulosa HHB12029]
MNGIEYPHHLDVDQLDVLVHRPEPHAPIRALSAAQFATLHLAHACLDTPDSVLFPFLHGLESDNHQQIAFFSKTARVPSYRGLVWVVADEDIDPPQHSPTASSSLGDESDDEEPFEDDTDELYADGAPQDYADVPRGSVSSTSGSSDSLSDSWHTTTTDTSLASSAQSLCLSTSTSSLPHSRARSHLLTSTFFPAELLSISPSGPIFTPPRVPDGVSLRNFGIQAPIYATLSDVVVYSPKGHTRAALAVAERFKQAIEAKALERAKSHPEDAPPLLAYNVFVVTDPFTTFETHFSPLVSINSDGLPTPSYPDLASREKDEMRQLTQASEILGGIWLGNAADVPIWHSTDSEDPCSSINNPDGYDICVECQDGAPFPTSHHLRQAEDHLSALEGLWSTGFTAAAGLSGVATTSAPPRPAPNANAVLHLSCPSSPLSTQSTLAQLLSLTDFLIRASRGNLLSSNRTGHGARRALRILVHSADGYTDSSVLALCLIMTAKHCSLPEAYLELQVSRSRSFFVYQQDLPLLKRVEAKLVPPAEQLRKREREKSRESEKDKSKRERSHDRWGWTFSRSTSSVPIPSPSGSNVATPEPETPPALFPSVPMSSSAPSTPAPIALPMRRTRASTSAVPFAGHHSWFNDPRFDGSFPSRVLPFLYLGNLNHASNAYMLHALGITHVVSVGECALVPPPSALGVAGGVGGPRFCATGPHAQGSLWIEEREGRIKVLDIKGVCDDGIDSLRGQFAGICDWIDRARLEGGKVLVHCRVGVSRSATVTIAYVMKHLGLPLIDAYLIVRSRRLSVLIQPNMRLLYNLVGWEAELAHQKVQAELSQPASPNADTDMLMDSPVDMDAQDANDVTITSFTTPRIVPVAIPAEQQHRQELDLAARLSDPAYAERLRTYLARSLTWPFLAREVHLLNEKYLA